jgi:ribonuclease P protein component
LKIIEYQESTDSKLRKCERLCSKKLIESLFASGKEFKLSPFKFVYSVQAYCGTRARLLVSVPKRNHKRAVRRNFLKRRMKEAYRLNKHLICNISGGEEYTVNLIMIYVSHRIYEYSEIERKLVEALKSLAERIAEDFNISSGIAD